MSKHFLHGTQIAAGLQDVGGKRVAQHVWMHGLRQPLLGGPCFEAVLNGTRTDGAASSIEEHSTLTGFCQRCAQM